MPREWRTGRRGALGVRALERGTRASLSVEGAVRTGVRNRVRRGIASMAKGVRASEGVWRQDLRLILPITGIAE